MTDAKPPAGHADLARKVAGNTVAQALAELLGKLAVLGTFAVVARSLGSVSLGELTFAISLSVLLQIAGLGMDPLIGRRVARDRDSLRELLWNALGLKTVLGGVAVAGIVAVALAGDFSTSLRWALVVFAVSGLIDLLAGTPAWVLRGVEDMIPVASSQFAQRLIMAVIAIGSIVFLGAGVVAVSLAYLVGSLASAALLVFELARRRLIPRPSFSAVRAREIAVESLPLGASALLSTALSRIDAIILTALSTLAVVGIYGAAYRLIEATFFIGWAFGAALFPMLSRLGPDTRPSLARVFAIAVRVSLAGTLPVGAVFILFPAPLVGLIYGPAFDAAITPTRWLGLVAAVNGLAALALFALAARDRKRQLMGVCLAALIVNIVLNLALIPSHGATGSAIAMAAANIVLAAVGTWVAARDIGPVSTVRVIALTAIAFGAMTSARLVLGETWIGLICGLIAYGGALFLAHHRLFDDDTRVLRDWLDSRRPSLRRA